MGWTTKIKHKIKVIYLNIERKVLNFVYSNFKRELLTTSDKIRLKTQFSIWTRPNLLLFYVFFPFFSFQDVILNCSLYFIPIIIKIEF